MPVVCEIRPRRDATPELFKQLGASLLEWIRRESGDEGILIGFDRALLDNLLSGEPPTPLALQAASHHPDIPLDRIRQDLGALTSDRSLRFTVKDSPDCPRNRVIESLRQVIPADLVEDILIDDVNWTE
jgi:hypothetical protein